MRTVCAWCGLELQKGNTGPDGIVSHGICINCQHELEGYRTVDIKSVMESVEHPVILVDKSNLILTANEQAKTRLQKSYRDIESWQTGEVLDCVHSKDLGGCGNTKACTACAIRNAISETMQTGEPRLHVTTKHRIQSSFGLKDKTMVFSTRKTGEVVSLLLESVCET